MVAPLLARESESISEELQLNIVRAFLVIKHSVPHMVERGGGSIVCVSSDASKLSWPFMIGYSTARRVLTRWCELRLMSPVTYRSESMLFGPG